jgi:Polyphosphate kinase middle domain/Polyphosphate kinase N-terminal domain
MLVDQTLQSAQPVLATGNLEDTALYINRELSWLQFNWRVLEEALSPAHPLLERIKFLAIFAKNLDEFFMIRVSGLRRQAMGGALQGPPDGTTPSGQLAAIFSTLLTQLARHEACWRHGLQPRLREAGIRVCPYSALRPKQRAWVRRTFLRDIFPLLTPLAFDPARPFPHMANLSLNLAVVVNDPPHGERFARVKIADTLPRFVRVPDEDQAETAKPPGLREVAANTLVWIEDIIAANLDRLFPEIEVVAAYPFRITRDADLEMQDDEAADLLTTVEAQIERRDFGSAVRLEVVQETPDFVRTVLMRNLALTPADVYTATAPLGVADLMELTSLEWRDLKDRAFVPALPPPLRRRESICAIMSRPGACCPMDAMRRSARRRATRCCLPRPGCYSTGRVGRRHHTILIGAPYPGTDHPFGHWQLAGKNLATSPSMALMIFSTHAEGAAAACGMHPSALAPSARLACPMTDKEEPPYSPITDAIEANYKPSFSTGRGPLWIMVAWPQQRCSSTCLPSRGLTLP